MIEQEFVPYDEALTLKELGFNEPCHRGWNEDYKIWYHPDSSIVVDNPTFSQAFRWFREKYNKLSVIDHATGGWYFVIREIGGSTDPMLKALCGSGLKSYEEAELACLRKLIEIANEKLTDSTRIPT